jgi:hypothetical protein
MYALCPAVLCTLQVTVCSHVPAGVVLRPHRACTQLLLILCMLCCVCCRLARSRSGPLRVIICQCMFDCNLPCMHSPVACGLYYDAVLYMLQACLRAQATFQRGVNQPWDFARSSAAHVMHAVLDMLLAGWPGVVPVDHAFILQRSSWSSAGVRYHKASTEPAAAAAAVFVVGQRVAVCWMMAACMCGAK